MQKRPSTGHFLILSRPERKKRCSGVAFTADNLGYSITDITVSPVDTGPAPAQTESPVSGRMEAIVALGNRTSTQRQAGLEAWGVRGESTSSNLSGYSPLSQAQQQPGKPDLTGHLTCVGGPLSKHSHDRTDVITLLVIIMMTWYHVENKIV